MSGGSFHWLFSQYGDDLFNVREDLDLMEAELRRQGYPGLATRTAEVRAAIHEAVEAIDAKAEPLRMVWRAVEWLIDGDGGAETLKEAAAAVVPETVSLLPWDEMMTLRWSETIRWMEAWLATQPSMSAAGGLQVHRDWSVQFGRALVTVAGAREATIATVNQTYRVDLFGIKATSTGGLAAACQNWLIRARTKVPA